jgi:hypothetical protein
MYKNRNSVVADCSICNSLNTDLKDIKVKCALYGSYKTTVPTMRIPMIQKTYVAT